MSTAARNSAVPAAPVRKRLVSKEIGAAVRKVSAGICTLPVAGSATAAMTMIGIRLTKSATRSRALRARHWEKGIFASRASTSGRTASPISGRQREIRQEADLGGAEHVAKTDGFGRADDVAPPLDARDEAENDGDFHEQQPAKVGLAHGAVYAVPIGAAKQEPRRGVPQWRNWQ